MVFALSRFWRYNILIYLHNESFFFPNIIPCAFKSDQVTFFYFSYIAQALPSSSINWLPRNQYGHMIYCLVIGWACCIKVKSTHGRGPLDLYGNMILDGKNIKPYMAGFHIFRPIYIVWNVYQNIPIRVEPNDLLARPYYIPRSCMLSFVRHFIMSNFITFLINPFNGTIW